MNPYHDVNWATVQQLQSVSHDHPTINSQTAFDSRYNRGIRHLAPSQYVPAHHNFPLSDFWAETYDMIGSPNSEKVQFSDSSIHMCAIGSLYNSEGHNTPENEKLPWRIKLNNCFANLQHPDVGGMTINHTNDYLAIVARLDYDPKVLGMEIWNGRLASYPDGQIASGRGFYLNTWDRVLRTGRRCFGFCAPDSHVSWSNHVLGRNVLLVPSINQHETLKAYRDGRFYGALVGGVIQFTKIEYNGNVFTVETDGADRIEIVHGDENKTYTKTTNSNTATYTVHKNDVYVRAMAYKNGAGTLNVAPDEMLFTNAVQLKKLAQLQSEKRRKRIKKYLLN